MLNKSSLIIVTIFANQQILITANNLALVQLPLLLNRESTKIKQFIEQPWYYDHINHFWKFLMLESSARVLLLPTSGLLFPQRCRLCTKQQEHIQLRIPSTPSWYRICSQHSRKRGQWRSWRSVKTRKNKPCLVRNDKGINHMKKSYIS